MDIRKLYRHFQMRFRMKLRTFMSPITPDEAQEKRELFSKLYGISAVFTFGYAIYLTIVRQYDFDYGSKSPTPPDIIKKLNVKGDVKVINLEGFTKVNEYTYNKDKPNEIIVNNEPSEENVGSDLEESLVSNLQPAV